MIAIESLTTRFRGKIVFDNFCFKVGDGESWVFIGDHESGAAALLKLIAEKIALPAGSVTLVGNSPFGRNRIAGYVPQNFHLRGLSNTAASFYQQRFNLSGEEDADTVQRYLLDTATKVPPGHWTYTKVIDRFRLQPLVDKQLLLLSNGETRRVLIAAALIRNPMVLLLDYPLTGLDVETRMDIHQLLREEMNNGVQVVMTSSTSEIPEGVTHIAVFDQHKVVVAVPRAAFDITQHISFREPRIDVGAITSLLKKVHDRYEVIVSMTNALVKYGDKTILKEVNWTIKQGERWALLGRNGAGKSTLLSLINGDNPQAYANQIVLFDRRKGGGESIWSIKEKIGYVSPEMYRYFPGGQRCIDVVASSFRDIAGRVSAPTATQLEKCAKWLDVLGLSEFADSAFDVTPANTQRLCLLARALVKDPVLLILDEPCEGLDALQQLHFISLINVICQHSDVTMIYVSHYADQIPSVVNKQFVLS